MFVIDASIVGAWYFPDERHPVAGAALQLLRTEGAAVPALFWFEMRNLFLMGERRKRIFESDTARFLPIVARLPITQDRDPHEAQIFAFARAYRLSIYDAAYLELAHRKSIPIATLDGALIKAARAEKIPLLGAAK